MKLLAFNNDANLKADLIIELKKHRKADAIIKGTYGDESEGKFRGCAVGCSINSYNKIKGLDLDTSKHLNYEKFGIPTLLARLEDGIFERLPSTHSLDWPINFMSAINVGADLSVVWAKFAQWLMTDEKYGVLQYAKTDAQKDSIQKVSELYKNGGSRSDFKSSADAAYATNAANATNATNATKAAANATKAAAYATYAAAYAADAANASYATKSSAAADAAADAYAAAATASYATNADAADAAYAAANAAAYAAATNASYANNAANAAAAAAAANAAAAYASAYASANAKRFEVRIAQSKYLIKLLKECK